MRKRNRCFLFTLILLLLFQFNIALSQKKNGIDSLVIYHVNERTSSYPKLNYQDIKSSKEVYRNKSIKAKIYPELNTFLLSIDTLKRTKLKGFEPYFLIEFHQDDKGRVSILMDDFGRCKYNLLALKDSVLVTNTVLIDILESNIPKLRKNRKKQNG